MTQPVSTSIHVQPDPMQAHMYSLCHALDVKISLSPTVSVRVTAAATIAAPVTVRSEKRVRMCVNTLRTTKSWKRMLTQSGTQQRCARPRGVCRPKQQCNKPSATDVNYNTWLAMPLSRAHMPPIAIVDHKTSPTVIHHHLYTPAYAGQRRVCVCQPVERHTAWRTPIKKHQTDSHLLSGTQGCLSTNAGLHIATTSPLPEIQATQ
jgi:hypothetical protein